MLRIQYNSEFLDLATNAAIELERDSPYYMLDSVLGEFSMPLTIPFTDKNVRLLGNIFFDYSVKAKTPFSVSVYDGFTFRFQCLLVSNTTNADNVINGRGNIQAYLLNNISVFYNLAKGKFMTQLQYSGVLNFTSSAAYLAHFKSTWDFTYDYIVAPIRNDSVLQPTTTWLGGWMNGLKVSNEALETNATQIAETLVFEENNDLYPFPKLTSTFYYLFKQFGWKVEWDLNDTDYEKLVLFNANKIGCKTPSNTYITTLNFSMAQMFSPEVKCTDFLLAICKLYNWMPLFDSSNKICVITAGKEFKSGVQKDFTKYLQSSVSQDYSADTRYVGWKMTYNGNDSSVSVPDFNGLSFGAPVRSFQTLPTADITYNNVLIYSFLENQWWTIAVDSSGVGLGLAPTYYWKVFTDNIYEYQPYLKKTTDNYESTCGTMAQYITQFRTTSDALTFWGRVPYCNQEIGKPFGIRTMLYLGMQVEIDSTGAAGSIHYPMLSGLCQNNLGTQITAWSNTYTHTDPVTGTDYGLIKYWWQKFINYTNVLASETIQLNIPLHELINLKWSDIILFRNVPFLLQSVVEPIPYKGFIKANRKRILLDINENVVQPIEIIGGGSDTIVLVYLKFGWEDIHTIPDIPPTDDYMFTGMSYVSEGKPVIRAYSDAACTIPYNAVNLSVSIMLRVINTSGSTIGNIAYSLPPFLMNGSEYNLATHGIDPTWYYGSYGADPDYWTEQWVSYQNAPGYPWNRRTVTINSSTDYIVVT